MRSAVPLHVFGRDFSITGQIRDRKQSDTIQHLNEDGLLTVGSL